MTYYYCETINKFITWLKILGEKENHYEKKEKENRMCKRY